MILQKPIFMVKHHPLLNEPCLWSQHIQHLALDELLISRILEVKRGHGAILSRTHCQGSKPLGKGIRHACTHLFKWAPCESLPW